ncbi:MULTISPECIES: hypothetical protein [Paenibacillus]|uniref:hypothetical protein n=1 Tax=Paenibacillus TaxID=44249 RepID=UPI0007BEF2C3|nr:MULTISPECIES: hypothetical protein [Paenibacillus]MCZ1263916.1 hypothetical protein [Paenibacillus tundrae]OAX45209.1 hypothetical protein gpAD87_30125 [Paenibacillus sp. AD87]WDQ34203.1 hypothetical protein PTQ21_08165 [Paenibacillus marchantiae]SDL68220.1 hypothetical protein SAMN05428961_106124 [Paenibacillus sp. OK060]SEB26007.1 hypothetical protein SAMN03159332_5419 [Paenibacillus sp. 276b]
MKKTVHVSQTYPRLTVYSEEDYRGRSRVYRGNTGLRNLDNILGGVESLRFFSTSSNATLVVFTRPNFQGGFRVFRGNTNLRDLDDLIRGNDVESLISTNQRLTLDEIRAIRSNRSLPSGYNLV